MNTGLQDAANLSWKPAAALWGHTAAPEALLDSYHAERHPVGAQVLRASGAIVRPAMAHSPLQRAVRALATGAPSVARPASDRALGMISGIGIAHPAPRGSHRLTGKRAPDLALLEGHLHRLLGEGTFMLVTPAGAPTPPSPAPFLHAHWTGDRTTALLVRPDGSIARAGDPTDPAALAR